MDIDCSDLSCTCDQANALGSWETLYFLLLYRPLLKDMSVFAVFDLIVHQFKSLIKGFLKTVW